MTYMLHVCIDNDITQTKLTFSSLIPRHVYCFISRVILCHISQVTGNKFQYTNHIKLSYLDSLQEKIEKKIQA